MTETARTGVSVVAAPSSIPWDAVLTIRPGAACPAKGASGGVKGETSVVGKMTGGLWVGVWGAGGALASILGRGLGRGWSRVTMVDGGYGGGAASASSWNR